ncbi:LLM class flavin-dependent oxidoreductase [Rhizobium leguminosarum]
MAEPSRERTPVLYQAGTSGRGRKFAARHAECVFLTATDKASARAASRALRQEVIEAGRKPEDLKIFVGITVIAGKTAKDAEDKHRDYLRYARPEAGLAHFWRAPASTSPATNSTGRSPTVPPTPSSLRGWTKRQLLAELAVGGRYPVVIGDGSAVAAGLAVWIDEGEIDGFNLTRTIVPESYEDL